MKISLLLFIVCAFSITTTAQKSLGIAFHNVYFNQVIFVYKKGPSDKAGILPGDRITKVNGKEITSSQRDGFIENLKSLPDNVEFEINRNGTLKTIPVIKEEISGFINKCVEGDCTNGNGIFNSGGSSYQGQFKDGKKSGIGTFYFTDGNTYTGQVNNDVIEGKGKLKNSFMEYEGGFSNNAYEGSGKIISANGDVLTALFSNNKIIGTAKVAYKNGDSYEGEYDNYKRNGFGVFNYAAGGVYEGNFVNNLRQGEGKMIQADKFIYKGMFENDNYEGKGELTYPDGSQFTGIFKENKPDGIGKMLFYNGDKYEGLFTDFEMTGNGKYWFKDGRFYEGEFVKSKMHGKGKYTWPNGDVFEGYYENNLRSGSGTYYDKAKNTSRESSWVEDKEIQLIDAKNSQKYNEQHSKLIKENFLLFDQIFKESINKFINYKGLDSLVKNNIVFYDYKGPKFWGGFPALFRDHATGKLNLSFEITDSDPLIKLAIKQSISNVVLTNNLQKMQELGKYEGEDVNTELYIKGDKLYFGITEFLNTKKVIVCFYN